MYPTSHLFFPIVLIFPILSRFPFFDFATQVVFPKKKNTFCAKCVKHTSHKVTQYKKGQSSLVHLGKRRYDMKQKGYGGQTKPIFHKKAKTTKVIVVKLQCSACKKIHQHTVKRCKTFELGEKKSKARKDALYA
jgi:large subunit ribosomal protein L44e